MKTKFFLPGFALITLFSTTLFCQELTQVIRGTIVDSESQAAIPFATISIHTLESPIGTTSDENGVFRLENVPIGRHNLNVSFVGFETKVIPELMVTSGKEIVLQIGLKEKITRMEEVVIKAYTKKDKPLNSMALVSARTFSVEEARRYAGGFDDPARLASSFAGVATGYLDDNGIIIRGNAPKGLLWRLEGIEISNPNHFAGMSTFGGGGVSALSSFVLANSDFFTGAFPAEYGNAMSGVFDIKLRNGNNENYEHAVQIGVLGLDISSEGPFSKKSRASYLFNYRYSTFGLIKPILPPETSIPIYQDLSLKINVPTKKAGVFSLWALGADNKITFEAETDTSMWSFEGHQLFGEASQRMAAIGLNHRFIIGQKTYLNTSYGLTGDFTRYDVGEMDVNLNRYPTEHIDYVNHKHSFTSNLNHKFSARHANRTGFVINNLHTNTILKYAPSSSENLITSMDENSSTMQYRVYSQSRFNLGNKLKLNAGINGQYFALNNELIVEPRVGVTYQVTNRQAITLAYGKHSRLEPLSIYFAQVETESGIDHPNRNLNLSKAHHLVLAYDVSLNQNLRLKIEPYLQLLYDIPVVPDSSYSTINMEADWFFTEKLNNSGTGTNLGI
ncbi:MAG: TonB-dependent receptor, partial [Bacteroidetes bacterium]|nr:TonB-dependent receptor [Bacteroidota bacterium]